jgi:glycerol kinase
MAYQTADVIAAMEGDGSVRLRELRVDGGAARNDLVMQFQADVLDVPVVRPAVIETTALGAAYLAGLHVGIWPDPHAIVAQRREERRFVPAIAPGRRERLLAGWRRAVERSRGWASA